MSRAKEAAGRAAAEHIRDGMTVGLGTGSTVRFTLERLAERIRAAGAGIGGLAEDAEESFGFAHGGKDQVARG